MSHTVKLRWLSLSAAGTVLGFTLAVALAGIFARLAPEAPGKVQMAMWMVAPVWLGVLSAVFLFRDGRRAWGWLGAGNAAAWGLFLLLSLSLKSFG